MVDLNALYGGLYALIASGGRGTAFRATLTEGASGVLFRQELTRATLPQGLCAAWRAGPAPIAERTLQLPVAYWTLFDVDGYADRRLYEAAGLLVTAYCGDDLNDATPIDGVAIDGVEIDVGEAYTDDALGRRHRRHDLLCRSK